MISLKIIAVVSVESALMDRSLKGMEIKLQGIEHLAVSKNLAMSSVMKSFILIIPRAIHSFM